TDSPTAEPATARRRDSSTAWRASRDASSCGAGAATAGAGIRSAGSWRQALDGPAAVGFSPIADAVVEAVRGALPELDRSGNDAEAAPFGRPRHPVVTVTDRELLDARLERFATRDRAALRRCDGAETARDRSR